MASSGGVEVIDLTGTPPPEHRDSGTTVAESSQQERPGHSTATQRSLPQTPIVISDDEVEPAEPPSTSKPNEKPRRKRRPKPKKVEEGEVAAQTADAGHADMTASPSKRRRQDSRSNGKRARDGPEHERKHRKLSTGNRDEDAGHSRSKRRRRSRSRSEELFMLDPGPSQIRSLTPTEEPSTSTLKQAAPVAANDNLVLPSHVTAFDGPSASILPPVPTVETEESEDEDFIQYMDYDDSQRGAIRYFDSSENKKQITYACKHCGAEGDHKTIDCPVIICLTCGARNEHPTRSCPISKTCFTCGIKGHISRDCPNRFSSHQVSNTERRYDCDRCGSRLHTARECPTLWRMYVYVSDAERDATLQSRRAKEGRELGEGGEGYIGDDLWCYNCGYDGHLGDDCNKASRPFDFPPEPSAFGRFNTTSGPFSEASVPVPRSRKQREWEADGYFDDGYGFAGPSNVGRRGRDKERERMQRMAVGEEYGEEEEDWFGKRSKNGQSQDYRDRDHSSGSKGRGSTSKPDSRNKKTKPSVSINFNKGSQSSLPKKPDMFDGSAKRSHPSLPKKPDLSDRISVDNSIANSKRSSTEHGKSSHGDRQHNSNGRSNHVRDKDRHRDRTHGGASRAQVDSREQERKDSGRKYFGGYGKR